MATRKQSHIAGEFLYRWVPRRGRKIAQLLIDAITTAFFVVLALLFVCMALYSAWNKWVHLRTGTSKLIDPEIYADQIRAID